jgi:hypothetical protein
MMKKDKSHSERGSEKATPARETVKTDLFMFPVNITNYLNLKV